MSTRSNEQGTAPRRDVLLAQIRAIEARADIDEVLWHSTDDNAVRRELASEPFFFTNLQIEAVLALQVGKRTPRFLSELRSDLARLSDQDDS